MALVVLQLTLPWAAAGTAAISLLLTPMILGRLFERSLSSLKPAEWDYHDMIRRIRHDLHRWGDDWLARAEAGVTELERATPPSQEWHAVGDEMVRQIALFRKHFEGADGITRADALASRNEFISAWLHAIRVRRRFLR
jgi:hypothetical protein